MRIEKHLKNKYTKPNKKVEKVKKLFGWTWLIDSYEQFVLALIVIVDWN